MSQVRKSNQKKNVFPNTTPTILLKNLRYLSLDESGKGSGTHHSKKRCYQKERNLRVILVLYHGWPSHVECAEILHASIADC